MLQSIAEFRCSSSCFCTQMLLRRDVVDIVVIISSIVYWRNIARGSGGGKHFHLRRLLRTLKTQTLRAASLHYYGYFFSSEISAPPC